MVEHSSAEKRCIQCKRLMEDDWPLAHCGRRDCSKELKTIHVNVRLKKNRGYEWRQVQAFDLDHAIAIAERMEDVQQVQEASYVPGGVIT